METKKDIRKRILTERSLISKAEWEEKSRRIFEQVVSHPFFLRAKEIYCYVSCNHEADTSLIMERAWELGKKTAVPKIQNHEMDFFYIESFEELQEGYFHIPEPSPGHRAEGEGDDILVIMPGVAFDRNRNRIGYGKGFYDRYLKEHTTYQTLAVAFDFQMTEFIPADLHDVLPQMIITEENVYV